MKRILLTLTLLAASFAFAAEPVPTAPVAENTTVTATTKVVVNQVENAATNVVNTATETLVDKTKTAVSDGVSAGVASVKNGVNQAVEATKTAVDNVAPPQVRGEFASLVLEKLKKYSAAGEAAVASAVDEVKEQFPLVVKEYLRWHLAQNLFYIFVTLGGFITLAVIFYKTFPKWLQSLTEPTDKYKTTDVDVRQFKYGASGIFSGIGSVVVLWIVLSHLEWYLNSIKIVLAPRVYLIEQVAQFAQQISNR